MTTRTALLVGLCLVLAASSGLCQTARNLGMGGTGLADTSDVGAGYFNPAGVAWVPLSPAAAGSQWGWGGGNWGWQAIGATEVSGDTDYKSIVLGAVDSDAMKQGRSQGFSVSYADEGDSEYGLSVWSGTYGRGFGPSWAAGIAVRRLDFSEVILADAHTVRDDTTVLDLGVVYKLEADSGTPLTIGATLGNILDADDAGRTVNVGASMPFAMDGGAARGLVSLDVFSINDSDDRNINVGAEYWLRPNLAVRAGSNDGDFSLGAGYKSENWTVDVAFMDLDGDDNSIFVGGSVALGG